MKAKDIMNKDIKALNPFVYDAQNSTMDLKELLSEEKNSLEKVLVLTSNGTLLGIADLYKLRHNLDSGRRPEFLKIPVLRPEDDIFSCSNERNIDEDYLNSTKLLRSGPIRQPKCFI